MQIALRNKTSVNNTICEVATNWLLSRTGNVGIFQRSLPPSARSLSVHSVFKGWETWFFSIVQAPFSVINLSHAPVQLDQLGYEKKRNRNAALLKILMIFIAKSLLVGVFLFLFALLRPRSRKENRKIIIFSPVYFRLYFRWNLIRYWRSVVFLLMKIMLTKR